MKRVFTTVLTIILLSAIFNGILLFSEDVSASSVVSGTIATNTTWTVANQPYYVVGDVLVDNGTTLTIEAGVTVKFDGLYSLIVNGTLKATGTTSQPIIFTSNQSSPKKGDWNRIRLHGKNNTLDHCEILYGNYALYVMGWDSNNTISNCKVSDNIGDGVYLKKASNNTIDNITVAGSYSNGITLLVSENNTINNSFVEFNRAFGIYLRSSSNNTILNTIVSRNIGGGIEFGLINKNILIKNVTVSENLDNGIDLNGNDYNNITDCRIIGNAAAGIDFGGPSKYQRIENCSINENDGVGVDLKKASYVDIVGCNILENKGYAGIYSGKPVTRVNITDSNIQYNDEDGIELYETAYVSILNSTITDNNWNGISFDGSDIQKNNLIRNCSIYYNHKNGIYIRAFALSAQTNIINNDISFNIIHTNSEDGIHFYACTEYYDQKSNDFSNIQGNNIYNNTIHSNTQNGIYFEAYADDNTDNSYVRNNNIYNNTIYSNIRNGIHLKGNRDYDDASISYNIIHNNTVYSNQNNGIFFECLSRSSSTLIYNLIYNNTIYSNNENGIFFKFEANRCTASYNIISTNSIYSNNQNGISFSTTFNVDYTYFEFNNINSNLIYSNHENGILFEGIAWEYLTIRYNTINSNTIYSNNLNGICFTTSVSNMCSSRFEYNNINSNLIYSNLGNGIYLYFYSRSYTEIKSNNIFNNTIHSNSENGIYLYGNSTSYRTYIEYNDLYSNLIYLNNYNGIKIFISSLTSSYSSSSYYSYFRNNNIFSNSIYLNDLSGIYFYGYAKNGYLYVQYNQIYENTITEHINDYGVYAETENVKVSWQNSNIYNNTINSNYRGIYFYKINSHIVNINNISDNLDNGITVDYSTSNTFGYNKIGNNVGTGIYLAFASNNNRIQNNNITSNSQHGIFINSNSNYNTITRNDIMGHPDDGVNISGSTDNYLHHNNFKNNTKNAYDSTTQLNDWDDGTEGNWWDDYTGFDQNNDGIGDIPYDVPGGGSKDWYPIIKPANITAPHIENTTPEDNEVNVSVTTHVSITFSNKMNRTSVEGAISLSGGLTPMNFVWSNGDMTIVFKLSATLGSETTYMVTISMAAKDILENYLENTYKFSFITEDTIPPKITSASPYYNSVDIELNKNVTVTFSESMNSTSVTFTCSPDPGGWGVVWSVKNTVATYSHNDFGSLTTYTFRVTGGKDIGDNNLVAGSVSNPWSFRTQDVEGPEITTTYPSNGSVNVLLTANVVVTFNEQMNTTSVTFTCSPNPGGWSTKWTNGDRTVTYSHNQFKDQTIYTFHITAGKDIAENVLNPGVPNPWTFKTIDATPPKLVATSPAYGAHSILVNTDIIVTFNEPMDNNTVTNTCSPNPGGWSVKWTGNNSVATFSHNSFSQNTNYTFRITGGKDIAGNNLVSGIVPNPWWFTTQDFTVPEIIATMPVNNSKDIELDADVVVTFSEKMDTKTVAFSCTPNPAGWSVSWNGEKTEATYSHDQFGSSTKYNFRITAGKDLSGNDLIKGIIPNPWSFTTKDALSPRMISTFPVNGSSNIVLGANIIVSFSETMNSSSVGFTCSPNPTGWSVVWSANDTVATYMHKPFDRNTRYTFQISTGKDLAGNNLVHGEIPNPWSFTTESNVAPNIITKPLTTATEDELYQYDLEAFDLNNDKLTYTLSIQPLGMTINSTTGAITWTPTNAQVGKNPVVIIVSDGNGGIATQAFNITVQNVNDIPIITSTPITAGTQDKEYIYDVEATDIDANDKLTYSLQTAPSKMTIDSSTGVITWIPSNDDVGEHFVTVKVFDDHDGIAKQSFDITVENVNDAPEITSTPVTSAIENSLYFYDVQATDIDPTNDILAFSLISYPIGMEIDPKTGIITWSPVDNQVGPNNVVVVVEDGNSGEDSQAFVIEVMNVNDPPEIISTPVISATENKQYKYDVNALDVDVGDVLTYSLTEFPGEMIIDNNSGMITWTPTNSMVGVWTVSVIVTDGNGGTGIQSYSIMVKNVNDAPTITSSPKTSAEVDTEYNYDINADDIDLTNDSLTFSLTSCPDGMVINPRTGMITWMPSEDQTGYHDVDVQVSDGNEGKNTQSFTIGVTSPEPTRKEGSSEATKLRTTDYSIIAFIIILSLILVFVLFTYLRATKPPKTNDNSENPDDQYPKLKTV